MVKFGSMLEIRKSDEMPFKTENNRQMLEYFQIASTVQNVIY